MVGFLFVYFYLSSLSTRFGTVAVPNILLFQGVKPMARFNHTDRTLDALTSFIANQTGMEDIYKYPLLFYLHTYICVSDIRHYEYTHAHITVLRSIQDSKQALTGM